MKHYLESSAFIQETTSKMLQFNPMELAFRRYEHMVHFPESYSPQERENIENTYHTFCKRLHPSIDFEDFASAGEKIALVKHARYLPVLLHLHTYVELFYVFQGSCTHDCNGQVYQLSRGDFCFWQYHIPHKIQVTSDMDSFLALNVLLSPETLEGLFQSILDENNVISQYFSSILHGHTSHPMIIFHTQSDPDVEELLCMLYEEGRLKRPYYQSLMYSYLMDLFVCLLRDHAHQVFTDTSYEKPDSFLPVLQYIQNHYDTVSLQEICEKYHYSPAYLSRIIKKYTGSTFSQIITEKKMEQAEHLLNHTQRSITDIAQELGYHDASHFSTVFRKHHQQSPSQYRAHTEKNLPGAD